MLSSAQSQTLTVLHDFDLRADGGLPYAGVTLDQQGRIYGTTSDGGTGNGVVYRLTHTGGVWVEDPLYTFHGGLDGDVPYARVVFGPDGSLFGTTSYGGTANTGIVFNLRPSATICKTALCPWVETVIYNFTGGSDGGYPYLGDLTFDQDGNIYGTAASGGSADNGVVFKLSRSGGGWTESVLWSFTGAADGANPYSGVIFDRTGNLYGTAAFGGGGLGTVYELSPSPSSWTEKTLYSFTENDGGNATGGLTMDGNGNLFGLTGNPGGGGAYELTPSNGNWTFHLLQTFTGLYPGPMTAPTLDSQGNLYGALPTGGFGNGEIIQLNPVEGGWTYTPFYQFQGNDGEYPLGSVTFDTQGKMYGTSLQGGTRTWGTVWEITP